MAERLRSLECNCVARQTKEAVGAAKPTPGLPGRKAGGGRGWMPRRSCGEGLGLVRGEALQSCYCVWLGVMKATCYCKLREGASDWASLGEMRQRIVVCD